MSARRRDDCCDDSGMSRKCACCSTSASSMKSWSACVAAPSSSSSSSPVCVHIVKLMCAKCASQMHNAVYQNILGLLRRRQRRCSPLFECVCGSSPQVLALSLQGRVQLMCLEKCLAMQVRRIMLLCRRSLRLARQPFSSSAWLLCGTNEGNENFSRGGFTLYFFYIKD